MKSNQEAPNHAQVHPHCRPFPRLNRIRSSRRQAQVPKPNPRRQASRVEQRTRAVSTTEVALMQAARAAMVGAPASTMGKAATLVGSTARRTMPTSTTAKEATPGVHLHQAMARRSTIRRDRMLDAARPRAIRPSSTMGKAATQVEQSPRAARRASTIRRGDMWVEGQNERFAALRATNLLPTTDVQLKAIEALLKGHFRAA